MAGARVIVVGNGVAGASAAIAARAAGANDVIVLDGGAGASTLAPGALDGAVEGALPFAGFTLGRCTVATTAGLVRKASGRDLALLDAGGVDDGFIAVPTSAHHGWDARLLAAQWNDAGPRHEAPPTFVTVEATLLRFADERDMPDVDLARRHDDPARLGWLGERLREALARAGAGKVAALILPPWLGATAPRAETISAQLGLPVGEALATTLGPSGFRFEAARDAALVAHGVTVRRARVERIKRRQKIGAGFAVELEGAEEISADAVILATGGLVGGGLRYTPSGSDPAFAVPTRGRATVELGIALDAELAHLAPLGVGGRPLLAPGSLFGASPEQLAWPFAKPAPLECAGVLRGTDNCPLFVAGEVAADLSRTWLGACSSGQRAGQAAAAAVAP